MEQKIPAPGTERMEKPYPGVRDTINQSSQGYCRGWAGHQPLLPQMPALSFQSNLLGKKHREHQPLGVPLDPCVLPEQTILVSWVILELLQEQRI